MFSGCKYFTECFCRVLAGLQLSFLSQEFPQAFQLHVPLARRPQHGQQAHRVSHLRQRQLPKPRDVSHAPQEVSGDPHCDRVGDVTGSGGSGEGAQAHEETRGEGSQLAGGCQTERD